MRTSGILMPVFSLPSPYGIGTFGKAAFDFVDFLSEAGQTFWQILPLHPTGYGDSPYQTLSTFAGNPYFIDPVLLTEEGLLTNEELQRFDFGENAAHIDYGKLYESRFWLLRLAHRRFRNTPPQDYSVFCRQNTDWLPDFSLFMAIKRQENEVCWADWRKEWRNRDPDTLALARKTLAEEIDFWSFLQYEFFSQWYSLKHYANSRGIRIIGDVPIYVAYDSAEVWCEPKQFLLNPDGIPYRVAGVPPDGFSENGQLWGNPLYDWNRMQSEPEPFSWWKRRIRHALKLYDRIRIDHFRGFASYYSIPFGETTAKNGRWEEGPGISFFRALENACGSLPFIAEDLGFLTPDVEHLLKETGFPGMKVLQFAFDSREESDYLPHRYTQNSVVYTGTHDNDTILGWERSAPKSDVETARRYMHADGREGLNWTMIRTAMMSVSDTAIFMMPDLVGQGSEARINTPATAVGNWSWRLNGNCLNSWLAGIMRDMTALYGRIPQDQS